MKGYDAILAHLLPIALRIQRPHWKYVDKESCEDSNSSISYNIHCVIHYTYMIGSILISSVYRHCNNVQPSKCLALGHKCANLCQNIIGAESPFIGPTASVKPENRAPYVNAVKARTVGER